MRPPAPSSSALPPWAKLLDGGRGLMLRLHVQPGARTSGPAGRHGEALKLRIAAPANGNRANEALLDFLRAELAVPRALLSIRHGQRSRDKWVAVDTTDAAVTGVLRTWDQAGETR